MHWDALGSGDIQMAPMFSDGDLSSGDGDDDSGLGSTSGLPTAGSAAAVVHSPKDHGTPDPPSGQDESVSDASRLVRSPSLSSAVDYAYAAVVAGESLVFSAGACPPDAEGAIVGVGDVRAQAAQVMLNLEQALADAGVGLDGIVRTTVYVASSTRRELVSAWEVVRDALTPHDPPSTLLGVAALGYADQLVEVDAVAALRRQ